MIVDQRTVDRIVARAQNSIMGLGEPSKGKNSYSLSQFEPKNLESLAILLVSAHHEKWDIISLVYAAFEEIAERNSTQ